MPFNLFNFYQQPNTGIYPAADTPNLIENVEGGNGVTGTIADFNWYFPYAGERVPYTVIQGHGVGFVVPLFSDALFSPAQVPTDGQGLHWGQVSIGISGGFVPDFNTMGMASYLSGSFQPLVSGLVGNFLFVSGNLVGTALYSTTLTNILSGSFVTDNPNFITITPLVLSGNFLGNNDIGYINVVNSGMIVGGNLDTFSIFVGNSGSFFPIFSDANTIQYALGSTYGNAEGVFIQQLNETFIDSAILTYGFLKAQKYTRGVNNR